MRRGTGGWLLVALGLGAAMAWMLRRSDTETEDASPVPVPRSAASEESRPALLGYSTPQREGAAEAPAAADAEPPANVRIEGRILDVGTGAPADAVVGIWSTPSWEDGGRASRIEVRRLDEGRFQARVHRGGTRQFVLESTDWDLVRVEHGQDGEGDATFTAGGEADSADRVTLWVRRTFRLRGTVLDAADRPLGKVIVRRQTARLYGGAPHWSVSAPVTTRNGRFAVGPFPQDPSAGLPEGTLRGPYSVRFLADGYPPWWIDPFEVAVHERDAMVVRMTPGVTVSGAFVDPYGRPLAHARVVVQHAKTKDLRWTAQTDERGRWRLERLMPGDATIVGCAFERDLKTRRPVRLEGELPEVLLVGEPIVLASNPVTTRVLGLTLAPVDEDLRAAYEIPRGVHVVVWAVESAPRTLGAGVLQRGHGITGVERSHVSSVRELIDTLIAQYPSPTRSGPVLLSHTFLDEHGGMHVQLTPEQQGELRALRERLGPDPDR